MKPEVKVGDHFTATEKTGRKLTRGMPVKCVRIIGYRTFGVDSDGNDRQFVKSLFELEVVTPKQEWRI